MKYIKLFESFEGIDPLANRCKAIRDVIAGGHEFSQTIWPEKTSDFRKGKELEDNPYPRTPTNYGEENYEKYLELMKKVTNLDGNNAKTILHYARRYGRPNIIKHILSIYDFSREDIEKEINGLKIENGPEHQHLNTITPENRRKCLEVLQDHLKK